MAGRGTETTERPSASDDDTPAVEEESPPRASASDRDRTGHDEIVAGWASTRRGRVALTVFLVVVLGAVFAANMPKSVLKANVVPWTQPVLSAIGLDQNWGVFSPDPRMDTSEVIARISFVDGTVEDRTIDADRGIGEYRDYRWRKYEEQLWTGRQARDAWLPYAQWLTASDTASGHHVREVAIIRKTRPSLPPGPGPDYGPWQEIQLGRVTGGNR